MVDSQSRFFKNDLFLWIIIIILFIPYFGRRGFWGHEKDN